MSVRELDKADIHQIKAQTFLKYLVKNYPQEWKGTSEYTRLVGQLETFCNYGMRESWRDEDDQS